MVFPFRCAQEGVVRRVSKAQASMYGGGGGGGVWGHASPEKVYF